MSQVKASYSYDAPMDFINFTSLNDEEETQNIDSWFGKCLLSLAFLIVSGLLCSKDLSKRSYKKNSCLHQDTLSSMI